MMTQKHLIRPFLKHFRKEGVKEGFSFFSRVKNIFLIGKK